MSVKKFVVGFAFLALAACGSENASNTNLDSKSAEQTAVENGLRLPVHFENEDPLRFTIEERLMHYNMPALSFALIDNGEVAWVGAYGLAEAGTEKSITPETLFQAGSLAKPVTVAGAMRMQAAGLIDFETDIQTYLNTYQLPAGPYSAENPVNFQNLLAHTSGASPGGYQGYVRAGEFPTDVEVLRGEGGANSPALEFVDEPGTALRYSGGGYTLAELAMQDATGQDFTAVMDEFVTVPLGLENTTFAQPLPENLQGRVALGHDFRGNSVEGGWNNHPEQAAAGLWTTAEDLAAFLVAIHNSYKGQGDFLSQAAAQSLTIEQMDGHAFGWILGGEGEELSIRHYGGNQGYAAMMILYPETGDGAVILTNSLQRLSVANEMLRAVADVYDWPGFQQTSYTSMELEPEALQTLAGTYLFEGDLRVHIVYHPEDQDISVIFPNGDDYRLVPVSERSFVYPEQAIEVAFEGEAGSETLLLYGDKGQKEKPE